MERSRDGALGIRRTWGMTKSEHTLYCKLRVLLFWVVASLLDPLVLRGIVQVDHVEDNPSIRIHIIDLAQTVNDLAIQTCNFTVKSCFPKYTIHRNQHRKDNVHINSLHQYPQNNNSIPLSSVPEGG
jgi:hypothetical protein